jgi:hypothetical protein
LVCNKYAYNLHFKRSQIWSMIQGIQQKITYDCDCFLTAYSSLKYQDTDNDFVTKRQHYETCNVYFLYASSLSMLPSRFILFKQ